VTLGQGNTFGDVEISWLVGAEQLELERIDVYEG
jgi:hypothetical protein